MNKAVYQRLKDTGKLPSPSGVALELMRLLADEHSSVGQITATVELDPAISARLLKLVNSPVCGTSRTITSVAMAVKLLGRKSVRNLALALSLLSSNREGVSRHFDFEKFWSESVARAAAARGLVKHFGPCDPDEAFTVGLLSKIGRIALATAFPEPYDELLGQVSARCSSSLAEAEKGAFQIDHNALTSAMMRDWHIENDFCRSVRHQDTIHEIKSDDDSPVARIGRMLHLAGAIARILVEPRIYREDLSELLSTAESLGVGADAFEAAFEIVRNDWQELGAIFSVETRNAPSLQEAHTRASRGQQRILVVDDDPCVRRLLTKYLEDAGYDTLTADNGIEALRLVHTEGCPLIITDSMMPEMDGLDLCRAIRSSDGIGFAYIIMLTGQSDVDSLAKAFDAGADDFLTKPCQRQELLARLKAGVRALTSETKVAAQQMAIFKTNAELESLNTKLKRMATTDELTGLYNRREAMTRLEEYLAAANREGQRLACMMLDIDHFKKCNDTYGHDMGDAVLRNTAQVLQRCARAGETVFRLGGEEFAVFCPGSSAALAAVGAERLRGAVEVSRVERDGISLGVTISIGVAERDDRIGGPDDLLKRADEALYEAKRLGRNQVVVAGRGRPERTPGRAAPVPLAAKPHFPGTGVARESCGMVLVVDDDPSARHMARKLLEQDGFAVSEADCGSAGVASAECIEPDVILMDAVMPGMDGFQCSRMLKGNPRTSEIPIIMVSAQSDKKYVEGAFESGAQEYIKKPLQHREFVLRIRAMTALARGKKELLISNSVRGEQARAMQLLFDLSRSLASAQSIDAIATLLVSATAELMNSRRVSLMLPEESRTKLAVVNSIGLDDPSPSRISVPLNDSISGQVFGSGQPTICNSKDEGITSTDAYESRFFASYPLASNALVAPKGVVGVLNVTERHDQQPFEAHELEYLDLVCHMGASAIEQYQSGQAREHAHAAIVIGLAKIAEHRDGVTGRHVERVTRLAVLLAEELRHGSPYASVIDDAFLRDLQHAMPLHDIGKVSIPDSVLLKPGPLTDSEFSIMKRHADMGAAALQFIIDQAPEASFLCMAYDIAKGHHEWYDGNGYPGGLTADQIPLSARIAAVADVYDALVTRRPYKEALPHETAVRIIREAAGSHFDPAVVEAFLNRHQEFDDLSVALAEGEADRAGKTSVPLAPRALAAAGAASPL